MYHEMLPPLRERLTMYEIVIQVATKVKRAWAPWRPVLIRGR